MKRRYNIIATIQQNGVESRKACPIGEITEDELLEIVLAYYIIDYSNKLVKTLEKQGYHLASMEDGANLNYRELKLTDGSSIVITTEAA